MDSFTRLESDLVIGFGFSKANARTAIILYNDNCLNADEMFIMNYLDTKNPFEKSMGKHGMAIDVHKAAKILEPLNYRITNG